MQSRRAFPARPAPAALQLFVKIAIAHLLEDVGVPRFVDLEGFVAVWTDDFMHATGPLLVGWTVTRLARELECQIVL
jgi:hypothetical protein